MMVDVVIHLHTDSADSQIVSEQLTIIKESPKRQILRHQNTQGNIDKSRCKVIIRVPILI